jgi:O-antigen ligase
MLTTLEKRWPLISLVLLLALLASLFLWLGVRSPLTTALLIIALGAAVFFVVRRQVQAYRDGKIGGGRLVVTCVSART